MRARAANQFTAMVCRFLETALGDALARYRD